MEFGPVETQTSPGPSRVSGTNEQFAEAVNTRKTTFLDRVRGFPNSAETFLNELSDRYTFECRPNYRLKLRKSFEYVTLGVDYEVTPGRWQYKLKAGTGGAGGDEPGPLAFWRYCREILYSPAENDIRLYSAKIPLGGFLSVQFVAGHDFRIRKTGMRWRLMTTWGSAWDSSAVGRKVKVPVTPNLEFRYRWDVSNVKMPDVEGAVGTDEEDPLVDFDVGHVRFSIPSVDAVIKF